MLNKISSGVMLGTKVKPCRKKVVHLISRALCSNNEKRRRVVVTGMGMVTSLGVGVNNAWARLCNAESGILNLSEEGYEKIPCKVGGRILRGSGEGQLDLTREFSKADLRNLFEGTCYAIVAAKEALSMAGWVAQSEEDKARTGVAIGMGMVDMVTIAATGAALTEKGYNKVSPHFIPRILINMPAGHISQRFGFKGPNHCVSTACTTGVHSIGDAASFIWSNKADVMVCGGTEASLNPLSVAGFARMRALSTKHNDAPECASRPFDRERDGFVMSEGAGVLVLEELTHALSRGATIHGEVLGYGLSADANHMTAPSEDGDGAYRCMTAALHDAQMSSSNIGYVNAHATSTPLGDVAECRGIQRVFTDNINDLAISSTKGATGHLLGAAGSVETIFTLLACQTGIIPPTLNCVTPEPEISHLNLVPLHKQQWDSSNRLALTNSFGFGGTNASLCVRNYT